MSSNFPGIWNLHCARQPKMAQSASVGLSPNRYCLSPANEIYEVRLKSIRYGDQMNWKSSSKFLETIIMAELLSSYNKQLQNFVFFTTQITKKLLTNYAFYQALTILPISISKFALKQGSLKQSMTWYSKLTLPLDFVLGQPSKYSPKIPNYFPYFTKNFPIIPLWKNLWHRKEQNEGSLFYTNCFWVAEHNFQTI